MTMFTKIWNNCEVCSKHFQVMHKTTGKLCSRDCWREQLARKRQWSQLNDPEWCRLQYEEKSMHKIAQVLGCSETLVHKMIHRHGIPIKGRGERIGGDKHYGWKGGITPDHVKQRNALNIYAWRKKVFARDDYTCQECGARNGNGKNVYLNAHHIKPFAQYPKLRTELSNGKTLCRECHKQVHKKQGELLEHPSGTISSQA